MAFPSFSASSGRYNQCVQDTNFVIRHLMRPVQMSQCRIVIPPAQRGEQSVVHASHDVWLMSVEGGCHGEVGHEHHGQSVGIDLRHPVEQSVEEDRLPVLVRLSGRWEILPEDMRHGGDDPLIGDAEDVSVVIHSLVASSKSTHHMHVEMSP